MSNPVYLGSKEAAELLQMTTRRVIGLCNEGKIEGAFREGRNWRIPETSVQELAAKLEMKRKNGKGKNVNFRPCAVGNTSYIEKLYDIPYMGKVSELFTERFLERTYLLDRWIFCL